MYNPGFKDTQKSFQRLCDFPNKLTMKIPIYLDRYKLQLKRYLLKFKIFIKVVL